MFQVAGRPLPNMLLYTFVPGHSTDFVEKRFLVPIPFCKSVVSSVRSGGENLVFLANSSYNKRKIRRLLTGVPK
jgi:hypothetical protein